MAGGVRQLLERWCQEGHGDFHDFLKDFSICSVCTYVTTANTPDALASCSDQNSTNMARILVIEDEPELRTLIGQVLEAVGHEVFLAADGEQGLRLHRASPARLVITDIFMPGKEGLETIRAFRKEFPKIHIVAISGQPALGKVLDVARRLGAAMTLAKPFQPSELLSLVETVLDESADALPGADDRQ